MVKEGVRREWSRLKKETKKTTKHREKHTKKKRKKAFRTTMAEMTSKRSQQHGCEGGQ